MLKDARLQWKTFNSPIFYFKIQIILSIIYLSIYYLYLFETDSVLDSFVSQLDIAGVIKEEETLVEKMSSWDLSVRHFLN